MCNFRDHTPKRRNITKEVNHYNQHRDDLKKDYQNRCGYCNDSDQWRTIWFEIDHFVPQKHLKKIKDTDYSNLVYSCRSCNNAKRKTWPTQDENVHHINNQGFIDPCDEEYNKQFSRSQNGRIKYKTPLGEWIYNQLKFYKPQHEIIWNIERLDKLIEECEKELVTINNNSLKNSLLILYQEYRKYTRQLGDY